MNNTTNPTNDDAQAEVQGHGMKVPPFGLGMPPAGFELETLGGPTGAFGPGVAPGRPVGAPAVPLAMRKAGGNGGSNIIVVV